ncbi:hypothetical protein [Krasilnikovia sp. M28-CT-15]|uniref:hypothetical protein n=1 Tax=Krasilnikovia sp. M28-CT-15 TaxID=3373540 RepID=UPI003876BED5
MQMRSGAAGASVFRRAAGRFILAGTLVVGLGALSVTDPVDAPKRAVAATARTPYFGAAVGHLNDFVNNTAAQDALKTLGVPVLVVDTGWKATDQTITSVLTAIQRTGATPYLSIALPSSSTDNTAQRWVEQTKQRFGNTKVYLEFTGGSMDTQQFLDDWNRTVPDLKRIAPAGYTFLAAPVTTANPDWGLVAAGTMPRPDALAWSEQQLCNRDISDDVCARRIPTLAWHLQRINAKVSARIGQSLPVFFNSWNVGSIDDERFLDNAATRKLTQTALTQLVGMKSLGLIGAAVGPAISTTDDENHFGRGLLHRDGSLTFQGTAYRDKTA